jgi:hypothetical protein
MSLRDIKDFVISEAQIAEIHATHAARLLANYDPMNDPHDFRGGREPYPGGCLWCHQMDETCPECDAITREHFADE